MDMLDYITEIQRKLIEQYDFPENPDKPGLPMGVTDGDYPMEIDGKLDHVKVINGKINCCNFDPQPA